MKNLELVDKNKEWYVNVDKLVILSDNIERPTIILKKGEIVVVDKIDTTLNVLQLSGKGSTFKYYINFENFIENFEILSIKQNSISNNERILEYAIELDFKLKQLNQSIYDGNCDDNIKNEFEISKYKMMGIIDCLDIMNIDRQQFNWILFL